MAVDRFSIDPSLIRRVVNREGDGASRSAAPQTIEAPLRTPEYSVTVNEKPGQASETVINHVGPGAGITSGVGKSTDVQGFVSPTGNKVVIDNTFGADTITLHHHSGATVLIDADGSIHIISTGKKGFGLVAPKGDGTVYSKGHLILKGDGKITLETDGDLDLNVGGSLGIYVAGDMSTYVEGSIEEFTDGRKTTEIVKEHVTMVGGDKTTTVAGNMRTQVSGKKRIDVAKTFTASADEDVAINSQKTMALKSKEAFTADTQETFTVRATDAMALNTQDAFTLKATGATNIEANDDLNLKAAGGMKLSSQDTFTAHASGAVDIRGSKTDMQAGGASPDDPGDADDAEEAPKAEYPTPEMIIDNMTTVREAPDFPKNAKRMSNDSFSVYKNDGETPNKKAEAASAGNKGAGAKIETQPDSTGPNTPPAASSYDIPPGVTSNGKSEKNPLPVPSSVLNTNQKISRHVTVGMIMNIRACPAGQQKQVLEEAMNTAWNILDPLIEKYGGQFRIGSWWRSNSSNHVTGGAVDISGNPRGNHRLTSEIAAYIRDNLPYKQLFLEKNDSNSIHVHVWAAPPGSGASGNVLTCSDPQCRGKVAGLQPSFAMAALQGRSGTA